MPASDGVDAIEHRVDQRAQLVERVAGVLHRHARVGAAGPHDLAHRVGELAERLKRRGGQHRAAGEADDDRARGR